MKQPSHKKGSENEIVSLSSGLSLMPGCILGSKLFPPVLAPSLDDQVPSPNMKLLRRT